MGAAPRELRPARPQHQDRLQPAVPGCQPGAGLQPVHLPLGHGGRGAPPPSLHPVAGAGPVLP